MSWWLRLLLWIAGVDRETLRHSPSIEWGEVYGIAAIMAFGFGYQAVLFALIAHRLFGTGSFHPTFVMGAMFLAGFILVLDRHIIMVGSWHSAGLQDLKRAGAVLPEDDRDRLRSRLVLALRIALSLAVAQLTAIFGALVIFGSDISSSTEAKYLEANHRLIAAAAAQADAQIQRASNSVTTQSARVSALSTQATRLTQNSLDPVLNDPTLQQLRTEIVSLSEQKAKAEESSQAAGTFAANEATGTKAAPGNTGRPGQGTRYKAAMQQAAEGKARVQELERKLAVAQVRLADARERASASSETVMQRSREQLPSLEMSLKTETVELDRLKAELAKLIAGRETTIRKAVEAAPDHVSAETGFLAQLTVLGKLADSDRKIAAVIILIDVISFALEAAALLSKILVRIPSSYAARVARDAHLRIKAIADELAPPEGATKDDGGTDPHSPPDDTPPVEQPGAKQTNGSTPASGNDASLPAKRGRGRPRKHPPPDQLVSAA